MNPTTQGKMNTQPSWAAIHLRAARQRDRRGGGPRRPVVFALRLVDATLHLRANGPYALHDQGDWALATIGQPVGTPERRPHRNKS